MDAPGREVWRALKKLDLLSVAPEVTHTLLSSCSPNVLRAEFDDTCINTVLNGISRNYRNYRKAVYKILSAESEGVKWY